MNKYLVQKNFFEPFQYWWLKLYSYWYEYYKGLTKNPKWLLMRKVGRFKIVRSLVLAFSKKTLYNENVQIGNYSLFEKINVDNVVESLREDGFYLGINLPKDIVDEIVQFARSTICYGNRRPEFGFYITEKKQAEARYKKSFIVGSYFNTALLCPAIRKLESDPKLLEIAAKYLEAEPVHQGNQLWWSFAGEATRSEQCQASQMFHYDLDDYRFLKFFFYLTDVDSSSGAHVCVRGSHEKKKLLHEFLHIRHDDKDIIDYYGADSLVIICGQSGFGFVEDTLCFHKGTTPTHRNRLMLNIEFAINDYGMQKDLN